jgi:adenylate cyclase
LVTTVWINPRPRTSTEIERKYLVVDDGWRADAIRSERYRQGYLAKTKLATVRVRCAPGGATLTVKSPRRGGVRQELDVDLPLERGEEMLRTQCLGRVIEKVRHFVVVDGMTWHVDVFAGLAAGLVLAEVELERSDQVFRTPPWVGTEVTDDPRFHNSRLALGPNAYPVAPDAAGRSRRTADSASDPHTRLAATT